MRARRMSWKAVRANIGNTGPQAPDVLDIGLAFGPQAQAEGLLQAYQVSTWQRSPMRPRMPRDSGMAIITG